MEKKNTETKRKSQSSNEGPPDKKARVDIENILLPSEDRNNDLSSHSIQNGLDSSNVSKIELIESSNNPTAPKENPTSSSVIIINGADTKDDSIPNDEISDHPEPSEIASNVEEDKKNSTDEANELSATVHQSTSVEEAAGIRVPCVNTADKLIECSILLDNGEKKIKWDDKKNSTSADTAGGLVKNSQDPQTSTNTPTIPRAKCIYGAECFRTNSDHKTKFSHPGDSDFNVKDKRRECRHGVKCYRKNPQHKEDYKHTIARRKRKVTVTVNGAQMLKKDKDNDSDKDSDESSFEESVDESEYGPSELDESSENENDVDDDDDSDW